MESRSKYSNIYFYAGVYSPQRFDFVKERFEFIDPNEFSRYRYVLESVTHDGDHETYEISFAPRTNKSARYKGTLYIDKKSLAYTGLIGDLTEEGLKDRNRRLLSSINYTSSHFDVWYREIGGRWHLNFLVVDGKLHNPKYGNQLRYTGEFVTTSLRPSDENPIRESEAIPYTAIYTQQEEKFSEGYWEESQTIARNSELQQHVNLLFREDDLQIGTDSSKSTKLVTRSKNIPWILKVALRMRQSFGVAMMPIENTPGILSVAYGNVYRVESVVKPVDFVYTLDYEFNYQFHRSFSALAGVTVGEFSGAQSMSLVRLGINYKTKIAGWRRPLTLQTGIAIAGTTVTQQLGSSFATSDFELNGTSFTTQKGINASINQFRMAVMPGVQLNYSIRPSLQLFVGVSIYKPFGTADNSLDLTQRKSFFVSRRASVPLDMVDFRTDGQSSIISSIKIPTYALFARVGISIGF